MCDHVLVIPSLTFTIDSDLASFAGEDGLKKELKRHFGIFFFFFNSCLYNWKKVFWFWVVVFFLVGAHCLCFRCNTVFSVIIRNLKLFQCMLGTPSINSWRSAHRGEADYWLQLSSASEKGGFFPRLDFFFLWQEVVQKEGMSRTKYSRCPDLCCYLHILHSVSFSPKRKSYAFIIWHLV